MGFGRVMAIAACQDEGQCNENSSHSLGHIRHLRVPFRTREYSLQVTTEISPIITRTLARPGIRKTAL
jgi:hypothetical protein